MMATIGIDLGTSNSAAAVLRGGRPVIIPSCEGISIGGKAFPSYVAFTADGEKLVGEPARRQAVANPEGTATAFKRKMGSRETIRLRDHVFTPEQLSAFLLQKIKSDAESFLGEPVKNAVVTVPAYFDDNQRSATKDACKVAGIEVIRLVNEPTAASLAYGLDRSGEELRIAVIDFGGGTLDVTIMEFGAGVFEVKSTSGDTQLGGTDMDSLVVELLCDRFQKQTGADVRTDSKALARVREAAEMAKIELSTSVSTHISLPYLSNVGNQPVHLETELKRADLEHQVMQVVERCRVPIEQALHDAGVTAKEIDRIVFVGGPTRMPVVRAFFEEILGRKAEMGVDPMECVASGAAIQAGVLSGEVSDIVLVDVTPLTLGIETLGGVATSLIFRNSPIPVKHTETFTTAADMQTSVTVNVYQGERPMARDNTNLGQFTLDGLPPAPRGTPKVDVTFDIDANGILNVTAVDQATKKSNTISIAGSTRLPKEDKERMVAEAERYAEEDTKRKENAIKLNAADEACYQAEKMLAEHGGKLSPQQHDALQNAMLNTRKAIGKSDVDESEKATEEMKKIMSEIGAALYADAAHGKTETQAGHTTSQTSRTDSAPTGFPGSPTQQRVVDAEFQEKS
ncbi:MAG: molecular chaperone DnaK [Planctomycetales bacterium]|nr:molecular chaperone DnaK [Planctomycetales bacterium]